MSYATRKWASSENSDLYPIKSLQGYDVENKQIQRIYVPRHFMFVFEVWIYELSWNNLSSQNRKQKQNLIILSKAYPYLQAIS